MMFCISFIFQLAVVVSFSFHFIQSLSSIASKIQQRHDIHLTLLLPAYNEEFRIRPTLVNYTNYFLNSFPSHATVNNYELEKNKFCVEILVVNDGSQDDTAKVVAECNRFLRFKNQQQEEEQQNQQQSTMILTSINCLSLSKNEGKGSAISKGLTHIDIQRKGEMGHDDDNVSQQTTMMTPIARQWVLVADADGSGDITNLYDMLQQFHMFLDEGEEKDALTTQQTTKLKEYAMLIGNRRDGTASPSRKITRWGFQSMVKLICGDLGVRDTQCGWKLMTLDAGLATYSHLHLKRWTHDVEVLYRARALDVPVMEMDVGWEDKEGSKLTSSWVQTIWVSCVMLLEILMMRVQYMLGIWKVADGDIE